MTLQLLRVALRMGQKKALPEYGSAFFFKK